ncbi:GNAT family N-acetyltransferase [Streptococcus saliviloxodontae]|uniref:Acetyltransferase n=1 Tax=Streptococcus saliviloxodontae TaxID=1349416 RepID=A0ABS2PNI1_9STRE|nr:GNAT family N-acetyltransferase [Streptococcus saliviloxodontae]MBM7636990.1 putative acetyltransferase [Streptococcus saliviloxodontae]
MLELRRPNEADRDTVLDMMAEFEELESAHDGGFWPSESFCYEEWIAANLDAEMGIGIPQHWVPSIQFVAFDEHGKALGFLSLRLRLNDHLLAHGGNIGYSVRPSQRGQGYAKSMLKQAIEIAASKNITRLLVTCHKDNAASRSVILANGGQLEDVRDGTERYWIEKRS